MTMKFSGFYEICDFIEDLNNQDNAQNGYKKKKIFSRRLLGYGAFGYMFCRQRKNGCKAKIGIRVVNGVAFVWKLNNRHIHRRNKLSNVELA
jgi:hypothetical protein